MFMDGINEVIEAIFGPDVPGRCRTCGRKITGFRDEISKKEYEISHMCQECQDMVFGGENDG